MVAIRSRVSVAEVAPQTPHHPTHLDEIQMQLVQHEDVVTHRDTPSPIEKAQTVEIKDEVVAAETALSTTPTPLDEIQNLMLLVQQYVSINA